MNIYIIFHFLLFLLPNGFTPFDYTDAESSVLSSESESTFYYYFFLRLAAAEGVPMLVRSMSFSEPLIVAFLRRILCFRPGVVLNSEPDSIFGLGSSYLGDLYVFDDNDFEDTLDCLDNLEFSTLGEAVPDNKSYI